MKTAFRIVVGLVVITAVAYRTSPSHFKHVKALYGDAEASKRWKLDADGGDATAAQNRCSAPNKRFALIPRCTPVATPGTPVATPDNNERDGII